MNTSKKSKKKHRSATVRDSKNVGPEVKRTATQAAAEKKSIAQYVKNLKSDPRTNWEIIRDDPDYELILRAPLDSDLSGYPEYGWAGPFRYLEEGYAEAGPFSSSSDVVPYREFGLVRSERVLSEKELKDRRSREYGKSEQSDKGSSLDKKSIKDYSSDELVAAFDAMKKSGYRSTSQDLSEDELARKLGFTKMKAKKKAKKTNLKKKAKKVEKGIKKVAKSDAGRAGIGGGIGALALGPVGAIAGAGIAMATKRKKGERKNPANSMMDREFSQKFDEILSFFREHGYPLESFHGDSDRLDIWQYDGELDGLVISIIPFSRSGKISVDVDAPSGHGLDLSGYVDGWIDDYGAHFLRFAEANENSAIRGLNQKKNPSLAKSIRQRRARSAAGKASRVSSAGSEVSKGSRRSRLAKINPVSSGPMDKTLDQYADEYIKRRAIYHEVALSNDSSEGEISAARKRFDDAAQSLTLYAEIRNMDPDDLQRFMEHAAKKQEEAKRKVAKKNPRSRGHEKSDNPYYGDAVERSKMRRARGKMKRQPPPPPKPPPPRVGISAKSNPKSDSNTHINRCQKLWDQYYKKPTKKNLRIALDHLESMKSSDDKDVKKERARCLRVANKEAERLGMK